DDRQVPDVFVQHDPHAVVNRVVGIHVDDVCRHDVLDARLFRRTSLQDHFAGIVAFGNDAAQEAVLGDDERPEVLVGEKFDRIIDGGVGTNGADIQGGF